MRDRTIQSFRIVLTVIGLVLFVVYSGRATSASTDRKVSGIRRNTVIASTLDMATFLSSDANSLASRAPGFQVAQPTRSEGTEHASVKQKTIAAKPTSNTKPQPATPPGKAVSLQAKQLKDSPHPPAKPVIAELPNNAAAEHKPF